MLAKKKFLYLILLASISSNSWGDETTFLEACRSEVYDRLVHEDKIITALRLNLSESMPTECLIKYEKLKKFKVIENPDYFQRSIGDEEYRDLIDASLDKVPVQHAVESTYSNLSIKGASASVTGNQNASQIEVVKGYSILNGSK